jgi:hypothetical protein
MTLEDDLLWQAKMDNQWAEEAEVIGEVQIHKIKA